MITEKDKLDEILKEVSNNKAPTRGSNYVSCIYIGGMYGDIESISYSFNTPKELLENLLKHEESEIKPDVLTVFDRKTGAFYIFADDELETLIETLKNLDNILVEDNLND